MEDKTHTHTLTIEPWLVLNSSQYFSLDFSWSQGLLDLAYFLLRSCLDFQPNSSLDPKEIGTCVFTHTLACIQFLRLFLSRLSLAKPFLVIRLHSSLDVM